MNRTEKVAYLFNDFFRYPVVAFFLILLFHAGSGKAQCNNDSNNSENLKILSWNIYMLPHFWIHTGQLARARNIAQAVKNDHADIIVFQEAFDSKSRAIIWNEIQEYFPYQSRPPARKRSWKINSGVWIVSKTPIAVVKTIFFKKAKGPDRMATKGAILIEAEKNNLCYQLIGTHLQSDLDHTDVKETRHSQYRQIQEELLDECYKKDVPQFVVGDFNTKRDDSISYAQMINVMKVKECQLEGERCYSYDYRSNDFIHNQNGSPQLIDYILYRDQGERKVKGQATIKVFQNKWSKNQADLSDHFAISAVITMK